MHEGAKYRAELQDRRQELIDQMTRFEGFVHDNESKRRRALNKYFQELRLNERRQLEERRVLNALDKVKDVYALSRNFLFRYL
ncbi:unnamed protein product [Protopolystoma xenopodis]|uniref:DUF4200 domain-containing protein n=1 Tax=Protopolystoma xenopodis TaxID=117903 RepID=A0A448WAR3_9PLAT|nr:unnamed protein product [Protopolystoma xenopodis]